jgi:hypothetical protein
LPNRWTSLETLSTKGLGVEIENVESQFDEHLDELDVSDRDCESFYPLE